MRKSLEEERRKWEVEKMDCGILEEQNRRSLEHTRGELQREKSRALTLQHQVVELQRVRRWNQRPWCGTQTGLSLSVSCLSESAGAGERTLCAAERARGFNLRHLQVAEGGAQRRAGEVPPARGTGAQEGFVGAGGGVVSET